MVEYRYEESNYGGPDYRRSSPWLLVIAEG